MKKEKRTAVYAGTFDPITCGHVWMVEAGAKLFDELVVAIGVNPDKKCLFSLEERKEMIQEATRYLENVRVKSFTNDFLIRYAHSIGASFILRGIRTVGDYEYEKAMRNINGDIDSNITSVFLMPPREISEISSSMVKGLVGPTNWEAIVEKYVPAVVFNKLKEKKNGNDIN